MEDYEFVSIRDNFAFTSIHHPLTKNDAIIVQDQGCVRYQEYKIPDHTEEEYVEYINRNRIESAKIEVSDLAFLRRCPSLKYLCISLRRDATEDFDYSPLYDLPEVRAVSCQNVADDFSGYPIDYPLVEIDYAKIHGLLDLSVQPNKKTLNIEKIDTLRSLYIVSYKSKTKNLQTLFSSRNLQQLIMVMGNQKSLDGIEKSEKLQILYLYYARSLQDISALEKVKKTLKVLCLDHCPKIEDYSVLEKMENLQTLMIYGNHKISDIQFISKIKSLKRFRFSVNILDGDLSPCLKLEEATSMTNRKHYNLKDEELPKNYDCPFGNEGIEDWMLYW